MFNDQDFNFDIKKLFMPFTTVKATLIIIFLGYSLYFFSLFNGFVRDDISQVVNNNLVHSVSNIPLFFRGATFGYGNYFSGGYYKPIMDICFAFIYSIFGQHAFFFHFFQVTLYICNAILVFLFFQKLFRKKTAFFLSLLFLVHPINTEVAVYISDLQDILFFFFGMLALLTVTNKNFYIFHVLSILFLLCSLFSKETGVAFALIIPAYIILVRRKKVFDLLNIEAIFVFILYIIIHVVLYPIVVTTKDFPFPMARLTLLQRLFNIPSIILFYLKTFLAPIHLAVSYDWTVITPTVGNFYVPLVLIIVFFSIIVVLGRLICIHQKKSYKTYLFFTAWFIIGLALHIQIIPLDKTVAERWFYFPIVGLLGILGLVYERLLVDKIKHNKISIIIPAFLIISIAFLSIRTYIRTLNWIDNYTLSLHDISSSQDDFVSEAVLAQEYENQGKMKEGFTHIQRSIAIYPYWWQSWNNLGTVYSTERKITKDSKYFNNAERAYKKAIALDSTIPIPYENLAGLYVLYNNNTTMTEAYLKKLVQKFPNDDTLWYYLAITESKLGNKQLALDAITQAQALNPNDQRYSGIYYFLQHNLPINIQE